MGRQTRLTEDELRVLRDDCLVALRQLTETNHPVGKTFGNQRYYRPCVISWDAFKIREQKGIDFPSINVIRSKVPKIMDYHISQGRVDVAYGKVERLYRAR